MYVRMHIVHCTRMHTNIYHIYYIYIYIFLKTLYTSASSALRKRFFNSVADAPRRRSRLLREKSFGKMVNFAWRSTTSDARQRKQKKTMIHAQETMTVTLIIFVVMIFEYRGQ